ncbi:ABC transporter permease subunit [Bacillus sp. JCM 19041]|uniref:ABC transporter permease subunit n=1 Tax=Bacillus sp. JCM 19041 TaxID=1460637 RepID=UPI00336A769D
MLENIDSAQLNQQFLQMYSQEQQLLYFIVIYLAAPFFLLIPVMVASVITANSFAGEKERKTLEGLLYTPVSMGELFIGKALAAFVPAIVTTFASFIVYGILVNSLAYPVFSELIFPTFNWVVLIFLIVPLLVLCIIFINIFISAKVKGFQEAYQLGGVVVLPIIGLVIGQATGFLFISVQLLLGIGVGLAVICFVLFSVIKKKMNRYEFLERMN